MLTFWTDLIYLATSVAVALWVGWTLHRNGRVFLLEVFHGKEDMADSVNHLILVGFYLLSIGFVAVAIRINIGAGLQDMDGAIQVVSTKVGLVLLVLGVTHFLNLLIFSNTNRHVPIEDAQILSSPDTSPERAGEESELRATILDALEDLEPKQRAAVVMPDDQGFSEADTDRGFTYYDNPADRFWG